MKLFSILVLLCLFQISFGQHGSMDAYSSKFYLITQPHNDTEAIKFIAIKEKVGDTVIDNKTYNKIKWTRFKDYDKERETSYQYELLNDSLYEKGKLNNGILHSFNISKDYQTGYLFGVKGIIQKANYTIESDTQSFFPAKAFKYFLADKPELYVVVIPGTSVYMEHSDSGTIYQLLGTQYNIFYNTLKNNDSVSNKFNFEIGDEIKITAKMQTRFEFDQPKFMYYSTFKYIRDTVINNNKTLVFSSHQYNYATRDSQQYGNIYIRCTDSGFYVEKDFIRYRYKHRKINIASEGGVQYASFQTIDTFHIANAIFPVVCQSNNLTNGISRTIPYLLFSTYQSEGVSSAYNYINYQGLEYGTKMNPMSDTSSTKIINTYRKDKTTAVFDVYTKDSTIVSITLENPITKQTYNYKGPLEKGIHTVSIENVPEHISYKLTFEYVYPAGYAQGSEEFTFDK